MSRFPFSLRYFSLSYWPLIENSRLGSAVSRVVTMDVTCQPRRAETFMAHYIIVKERSLYCLLLSFGGLGWKQPNKNRTVLFALCNHKVLLWDDFANDSMVRYFGGRSHRSQYITRSSNRLPVLKLPNKFG